jgi:hypothetical protein
MSNFKPQIRVITEESLREHRNSIPQKSAYKSIQYTTYKELKKNIKKHLEENLEPTVSVYRSRRGEWGEWFEHWMLEGGKPKIVKQGWM